jgi:predicted RNase H-like HicB family nuclease
VAVMVVCLTPVPLYHPGREQPGGHLTPLSRRLGAPSHAWQPLDFQAPATPGSAGGRSASQEADRNRHPSRYHEERRLEVAMYFPIAIHKDPDSDYGVTVPDLPGCFSAGSTVDEAMLMAAEAIELYLETLIEEGRDLPFPSEVETLKRNPDYADAIWALVDVDYERKTAA